MHSSLGLFFTTHLRRRRASVGGADDDAMTVRREMHTAEMVSVGPLRKRLAFVLLAPVDNKRHRNFITMPQSKRALDKHIFRLKS